MLEDINSLSSPIDKWLCYPILWHTQKETVEVELWIYLHLSSFDIQFWCFSLYVISHNITRTLSL